MTKTFALVEHNGGDMPPRFYVNGVRVTGKRFADIRDRAHSEGQLSCFFTKARQLGGGRFRRVNYSVAVLP